MVHTRPQQLEDWARPIELGELDQFIGFRLKRVQNHLARQFSLSTREKGLRSGSFSCLALISANPGLSQMELAKEVALDKSSVAVLIDDLETHGLAKRMRSRMDRRRYSLFTTEAGEAVLGDLFRSLERIERELMNALAPDEVAGLQALLDKIYQTALRDNEL